MSLRVLLFWLSAFLGLASVQAAPTTTTVASTANPSVYGDGVAITATVSAPSGGTPTGTVIFKDGAAVVATNTLDANGVATLRPQFTILGSPYPGAGSHVITATYSGDANFAASASAPFTQVVGKASTTTTVTALHNPTAYGEYAVLRVVITSPIFGATFVNPALTFKDGANVLTPQQTLSQYPVAGLVAGDHQIAVSFAGNANFQASTSAVFVQTVTKATPTVTLASSGAKAYFGQNTTFSVAVSPSAIPADPLFPLLPPSRPSPTGTVTFRDGAAVLGSAPLPAAGEPAMCPSLAPLSVGTHAITAEYSGDANYAALTTAPFSQVINPPVRSLAFNASTDLTGPRSNHTATLLPDGRLLVTGGTNNGARLSTAERFDPATMLWASAKNLTTARSHHTATLLPNGKVLISGGYDASGAALASASLYDPASDTWAAARSMAKARASHTATLLPDGTLLVAGGSSTDYSSEIYHPATDTWTSAGSSDYTHQLHTATLLSSGSVLVVGGFHSHPGFSTGPIPAVSEVYDPAYGLWNFTAFGATLGSPRSAHTATLLPGGKVLVVGGVDDDGALQPVAMLYDPGTYAWTEAPGLLHPRFGHTATLLPSGKVLISGGQSFGVQLASSELYDPADGSWTEASALNTARVNATATLLASGRLLIAGGSGAQTPASAEFYEPPTGGWTTTAGTGFAHFGSTLTPLRDGRVLLVGEGSIVPPSHPEIYDPVAQNWSVTGPPVASRSLHSATLLPDGRVLVAGGYDAMHNALATAEIYDPSTGGWTATGSLAHRRFNHTATLLPDGRVLVAGGSDGGSIAAELEVFDPATGQWSVAGNLLISRASHTATLLPGGQVLIAGGLDAAGYPSVAELYDPVAGTTSSAGATVAPNHIHHTATLLPNGKVLLAGGSDASGRAPSELYDPATGGWTLTGNMVMPRGYHTATLLPNGLVLVAGGTVDGNNFAANTELYDYATATWQPAANSATDHYAHNAILLPDGKVLVTGGYSTLSELYDSGPGLSPARRPQIDAASTPRNHSPLTLAGDRLAGPTGGGSGNTQDSSANFPIVQLRRLANDQLFTLSPGAGNQSFAYSYTSTPLSGLAPGAYEARVFSNGIPSEGVLLQVPIEAPQVTTLAAASVAPQSVTLQARVTANGLPTTVAFSYTTDPAFLTNVSTVTVAAAVPGTADNQTVTQAVTGLAAHTTYYFHATATSSGGSTTGSGVSFRTGNTAPVASTDLVTGAPGVEQTITLTYPATDADGDPVTLANVIPAPGVVIVGYTDRQVTFQPTASFAGTATLTFYVSDSHDYSTGYIVLTVPDAPPVVTLNGANPLAVPYGGTYVEPGATANDAVNGPLWVTTTGTVNTFVPGSYTITYSASTYSAADSALQTTTATRTVVVGAVPAPVATADRYFNGSATTAPLVLHVLANDTAYDPASIVITAVTRPQFGSAVVTGNGKTITYTPRVAFATLSSSDTFTYTIRDGFSATASAQVTISNGAYRLKGVYDTLLKDGAITVGYLQVTLTGTGAFTGTFKIGTTTTPLRGQLDTDNHAALSAAGFALALSFSDAGEGSIGATVSKNNGSAAALLTRQTWNATTNPAPQAGSYTIVLPPPPGPPGTAATATATVDASTGKLTGLTLTGGGSGYVVAPLVTIGATSGSGSGATATAVITGGVVTSLALTKPGLHYANNAVTVAIDAPQALVPAGPGYATMKVSQGGAATLAGKLGDGTTWTGSAGLKSDGSMALYSIVTYLPGPTGVVGGLVAFRDLANLSDCDSQLTWTKPPQTGAARYRGGFSTYALLLGSRYVPPAKGEQALAFGNATLGAAAFRLQAGDLLAPINDPITVSSANVVKAVAPSTDQLSLTLTPASGLLTGTLNAKFSIGGAVPTTWKTTVTGVLYQKQTWPKVSSSARSTAASSCWLRSRKAQAAGACEHAAQAPQAVECARCCAAFARRPRLEPARNFVRTGCEDVTSARRAESW